MNGNGGTATAANLHQYGSSIADLFIGEIRVIDETSWRRTSSDKSLTFDQDAMEDWLDGLVNDIKIERLTAERHPAVEDFREPINWRLVFGRRHAPLALVNVTQAAGTQVLEESRRGSPCR